MAELITMPKLGFDMAEGKLSEWLKKPGEAITQGETILLVETDKATVEVPAFRGGVLLQILVEAGESALIGAPIGVIGAKGEKADLAALGVSDTGASAATEAAESTEVSDAEREAPQGAAAISEPAAPAAAEGGRVLASPVALRMAAELGIDLRQVQGSGPMGRVIKRDIETHLQERDKAPQVAAPPPIPTPSYEPSGADYTVEPLSGIRQTIGKRMTESKQTAPHFYVTMDIDMEAAMALRSQLNAVLPETDKISVNDLVQKAAAIALREFPRINASWSAEGIRVHNQVNIGHAVARENGLVTAVVRDVDKKPLAQVARETRDLATRARDGKMKPDEMVGGTFTMSNLGMFDVDEFIAIINPPQATILAVGAVQKVPVVNAEGQVVAGLRMKATISADHRVTDGAEAARFMQALKKALEEPVRLLI